MKVEPSALYLRLGEDEKDGRAFEAAAVGLLGGERPAGGRRCREAGVRLRLDKTKSDSDWRSHSEGRHLSSSLAKDGQSGEARHGAQM